MSTADSKTPTSTSSQQVPTIDTSLAKAQQKIQVLEAIVNARVRELRKMKMKIESMKTESRIQNHKFNRILLYDNVSKTPVLLTHYTGFETLENF